MCGWLVGGIVSGFFMGRQRPQFVWLSLALGMSLCCITLPAQAEEMLRIAMVRSSAELVLSGPDLVVTALGGGEVLLQGSVVKMAPTSQGIVVNGKRLGLNEIRVTSRGSLRLREYTIDHQVEVFTEQRGGTQNLLVVHEVPIETYVAATVAKEMPSSWPEEALKAQAVATRTFAVYRKFSVPDRPYHMESGVIDQVYGGGGSLPKSVVKAVAATRGEVLTYQRRPIKAYFHSCCAGHTESALEGWGQRLKYLPGVSCDYDQACPAFHYHARVAVKDLIAALRRARIKVRKIDGIRITKKTKTRRVAELVLATDRGEVKLSGEDLRRLVGYKVIKSRVFRARLDAGVLVVDGQGSGHGVGMCQWGARGMALKKKSYREILFHYYPHTRLQRMY